MDFGGARPDDRKPAVFCNECSIGDVFEAGICILLQPGGKSEHLFAGDDAALAAAAEPQRLIGRQLYAAFRLTVGGYAPQAAAGYGIYGIPGGAQL